MTERADTMTRPTVLDMDLVVVPSKADVGMLGAWYRYKSGHRFAGEEPARDTSDVGAYSAMLSASPYSTAWGDVRKYVDGMEESVAFTMTDTSRMLRKFDIKDVCPHPDDCFYDMERVRCGPCAVKASKLAGIEIDDTHSHLPEVCRLRREMKAAEARIGELEADHLEERLAMSGRIQFLEDASAVPHLEHRIAELEKEKHAALTMIAMVEKRLADAERVSSIVPDARLDQLIGTGDPTSSEVHDMAVEILNRRRAALAYMEGK